MTLTIYNDAGGNQTQKDWAVFDFTIKRISDDLCRLTYHPQDQQASAISVNTDAWKVQCQFTVTNYPALLQAYDTNQAVLANALAEKARNAVISFIGVQVGAGIVHVAPRLATRANQNARHCLIDIYLEKGRRYHVSRRRMIRAGQAVAVAFAVNYIGISNRGLDNVTPELAPVFQLPGLLSKLTVYATDGDIAQATQMMLDLAIKNLRAVGVSNPIIRRQQIHCPRATTDNVFIPQLTLCPTLM
ncbi:hypothetical protein NDA11_000598 [Ustilago hordei]|nr:hypothetical protein NDA11_000598 [Ustilago hordei]